ncbi:MAG TPA: thioredoxin family protein [Candidatus Nitrosotalea sp.]|nr:thioredoxin family protein [Nitrososphaerota archaeon]HKU32498.1 thioredoxin family protein [Candidatus Nitrosotalea sp.]
MEHIKPEEFDSKILNAEEKTLVLFYASWCPYCSNFKPTFENSNMDKVRKIEALVDEDENPFWDKFNIQAVPTMIAFEKGKIIARRDAKKHVGLTKSDMESIIKELS